MALKEGMRAVPAQGKARRYMLRRRVERAPSAERACSIGRRSVLRRGVRLEALRIRHAVCPLSSPGMGAEEEPPGPNRILPRNQVSRNFNL
jgi:hypothetical protein